MAGPGVGARYNPSTGVYSRGAAAYGPYGGAAVGSGYNSRTGTYARGGVAAGPYGARGAAEAYNPRTGAYGQTRQGSGVYGSWGQTGVTRGDDWAQTSRVTNNRDWNDDARDARAAAAARRSPATRLGRVGPSPVRAAAVMSTPAATATSTGRQGDSWQKYDNGGWSNTQQPSQQQKDAARDRASQAGSQTRDRAASSGIDVGTAGQLNRDSAARSNGAQRTRDAGSVNSGAGASRAGSYRPSGGASRGGASRGGGRRR